MDAEGGLDTDIAVFLDTSLVIAATVEVHPSYKAASELVDDLVSGTAQMCILLKSPSWPCPIDCSAADRAGRRAE